MRHRFAQPGIIPILLLAFLHMSAYSALRPLIAFQSYDQGLDLAQIGVIFATLNFVQLASGPVSGITVDAWQVRIPAIIGSVVYLVGFIVLASAASIEWLLLIGLFLIGLSHIQVQVVYQSAVSALPDRLNNFGLLSFAASAGHAVGPLTAGAAVDLWGLASGFWVAVATTILAMIAALFIPSPNVTVKGKTQKGLATQNGRWRDLFQQPLLLRAIIISTVFLFTVDVLMTYFPLYGQELGLSVSAIGIILSLRGAASMIVRPFMGIFVEKLGQSRILISCLILGGLALISLTLHSSLWIIIPGAILAGLTQGLTQPLTLYIVTETTHANMYGRTMSLRLMGNRLAQTVSPLIFGLLADRLGLAPVFWISGGLLLSGSYIAKPFGRILDRESKTGTM